MSYKFLYRFILFLLVISIFILSYLGIKQISNENELKSWINNYRINVTYSDSVNLPHPINKISLKQIVCLSYDSWKHPIDDCSKIKYFSKLKSLYISTNDFNLDFLKSLNKLETLVLYTPNLKVSELDFSKISALKNLKYLTICSKMVDSIDSLKQMNKLENIFLLKGTISNKNYYSLKEILNHSHIELISTLNQEL